MRFIAWIVVGLIAGVIAKALMPGSREEPSGLLFTILLGIVGAVIGGFLSGMLLGGGGANGINISSIVISVIGACVFIGILRLLRR
ncbi:GlsB/YeaQ/YmgE family stress response membrane protein [Armatimonas sp.]|uniref:GlsB/YeaQ/YmgE family stress response membrane protein n=1 Tax=Armatimonas sp. TaxID=1872638 RepID=UPI0037533D13